MGPVLPFLTDSPAQLEQTVRQAAEAGAAHVTPIVLHLRPGAREWFLRWLGENFPDLLDAYRGHVRQERVRAQGLPGPDRRAGQGAGPPLRVGAATPAQARRIQPRTTGPQRGRPARTAAASAEPVQLSLL